MARAVKRSKRDHLPKLLPAEYARFRPDVLDCIERLIPERPSVILDPMAGTAPLIPFVATRGHTGHFIDLLPVHYYVNRLRTCQSCAVYRKLGSEAVLRMLMDSTRRLQAFSRSTRISEQWIDEKTLRALVSAWDRVREHGRRVLPLLRGCLLLSVRPLSTYSATKNPTWLRPGGMSRGRPLRAVFEGTLKRLDDYYEAAYSTSCSPTGEAHIGQSDAADVRIVGGVDFIVTSPAYCNRLEYRRMYGPELYFLEATGRNFDESKMLGTNEVRGYDAWEEDYALITSCSKTVAQFISVVAKRQIRSERTSNYYVKCFTRYFACLFRTFGNLSENLRADGQIVVITQDNSHRGESINIHEALAEFLKSIGFGVESGGSWFRSHLGKRNVSREYPAVTHKQVERVLVAHR